MAQLLFSALLLAYQPLPHRAQTVRGLAAHATVRIDSMVAAASSSSPYAITQESGFNAGTWPLPPRVRATQIVMDTGPEENHGTKRRATPQEAMNAAQPFMIGSVADGQQAQEAVQGWDAASARAAWAHDEAARAREEATRARTANAAKESEAAAAQEEVARALAERDEASARAVAAEEMAADMKEKARRAKVNEDATWISSMFIKDAAVLSSNAEKIAAVVKANAEKAAAVTLPFKPLPLTQA